MMKSIIGEGALEAPAGLPVGLWGLRSVSQLSLFTAAVLRQTTGAEIQPAMGLCPQEELDPGLCTKMCVHVELWAGAARALS